MAGDRVHYRGSDIDWDRIITSSFYWFQPTIFLSDLLLHGAMTQVLKAKHLLGDIVLDEHGHIVEHPSKKSIPEIDPVNDRESWKKVQKSLKDPRFFGSLREININLTCRQVKESVGKDVLIMQAIASIEELDRIANMLSKRLREWAGWWVPESSKAIQDHAVFARVVAEGDQPDILAKAESSLEISMGAILQGKDIASIKSQAQGVQSIIRMREKHDAYLKQAMQEAYPNLCAVAGHLIGAKLISHAGSLRHLSEVPSSTIQMLGAEKALFRHLTTGAKPPKYGVIFAHPLIQSAKKADQGRVARGLADKISIAVKVDYFNGKFIGDVLKRDLEKRFNP